MAQSNFIKQKYFLLVTTLFVTGFFLMGKATHAQQAVQIQVIVQQPVSPYLPQLAADIKNQQFTSLSQKLSIRITNSSNSERRIKLSGKIERVAPAHMSVSLRPDYQPSRPIILGAQQTILLTQDLVEETFGNFSRRQLMFDNLDLSALRQNEVNYKLPEGTYRICVDAYDFDKAGQSVPLSAQGANCAVFRICYTASAPQFTLPVSTLMRSGRRDITTFTPKSSQIQFAWTPPASTCGLALRSLTYDLEIREMFPGQSISDTRFSPIVFRQQNLRTNGFILDTLKYPNVFRAGKQYTVRVKANILKNASSPLEIANRGYSEIAYLEYKPETKYIAGTPLMVDVKALPPPPFIVDDKPIPPLIVDANPLPPIIDKHLIIEGGQKTLSLTIGNACEGVLPPVNQISSSTSITGRDITIGGFSMHVDQATSAGNNKFKGKGFITWNPFGSDKVALKLKVKFEAIEVNADKEVITGEVITTQDNSVPEWLSLKTPESLNQVSNINSSTIQPVLDHINKGANQINKLTGHDPVDFPLGLNNEKMGGGVQATLAITSISFKPGGTNMSILFSMNIADAAEANQWLSLAGTGFCIKPDGFSFENGIVYLPTDRKIKMSSGYELNFIGANSTSGSNIDLDKTTYLKWNKEGFERVFVNADFSFSKDALVAVNSNRQQTGETVKLNAKFNFADWNDWIANLNFNSDFELKPLPGFTIKSGSGFFYDHSKEKNPAGLQKGTDFPMGYQSKGGIVNQNFQGFYLSSINMLLPKDFIASNSAAFSIEKMIIDDAGVTASIYAKDIIKQTDKASLGGWGFSVDSIKIPIVRNNIYGQMGMYGTILLPISTTGLKYDCILNKGLKDTDGYGYAFNLHPAKNMEMPMWVATLTVNDDSGFKIEKEPGKEVVVEARLSGGISITLEASDIVPVNATIPLLEMRNLTISNKNGGFTLDLESLSFGGKPLTQGNKPKSVSQVDEIWPTAQYAYYAGGPSADYMTAEIKPDEDLFADDNDQGNIAGFGFTLGNFELKRPGTGRVGLFFDLSVNLGFGDASVLSGGANLGVVGAYKLMGSKPDISFAGVEVDQLKIHGEFGPVKLSGQLDFWSNDVVFGDGVHGKVTADFPFASIEAETYFGTKSSDQGPIKYGGAGGKFFIPEGIPIFGGLTLNGFGGGFYSNMKIEEFNEGDIRNAGANSSLKLIPEKGSKVLNVSIIAAYANPTIVNASLNITAEIENGGLSKIELKGDGHIITAPGNYQVGLVNAHVEMTFDFIGATYEAKIEANADFGIGIVVIPVWMHGGGKEKNAKYYLWVGVPETPVTVKVGFGEEGDAVYAYIKGAAYFCTGIGAGSLPPFPGLPEKITTFLNGSEGNQVQKPGGSTGPEQNAKAISDFLSDPNNVNGGFMFGAAVEAGLGLNFLIFYAKVTGLIGFDLAMVETKPGKTGACGITGPIGYKGYYAIGQLYAYFAMAIGVKLGVGDLDFISLQLGAYLRGGLPNPTWGEGMVGIEGEILGVIKFNETVAFDFGTKCYPEYDPLAHLELISETSPGEMSIFEYPYVVYNVPVAGGITKEGKILRDANGEAIKGGVVSYPNPPDKDHNEPYQRYYVFKQKFSPLITTADGKKRYEPLVTYGNENFVATYQRGNPAFSGETEYSFTATVIAYQYLPDRTLKEVMRKDTLVRFKTKPEDTALDKRQIANTYPINGQQYLLKKEFGAQGAINLYQFSKLNEAMLNNVKYRRRVQFIAADSKDTISTSFSYSKVKEGNVTAKISFPIPDKLRPATGYRVNILLIGDDAETLMEKDLVKNKNQIEITVKNDKKGNLQDHNKIVKAGFERTGNGAAAWNHPETFQDVVNEMNKKGVNNQDMTSFAKQNSVREKAAALYGITIFSLDVRTSKYNTFQEKMAGFNLNTQTSKSISLPTGEISNVVFNLQVKDEPFDVFEVKKFQLPYGVPNVKDQNPEYPPLLQMEVPGNGEFFGGWNNAALSSSYKKLDKGNDSWMLYNVYRYSVGDELKGFKIDWGLGEVEEKLNVFQFKPLMELVPKSDVKPTPPYTFGFITDIGSLQPGDFRYKPAVSYPTVPIHKIGGPSIDESFLSTKFQNELPDRKKRKKSKTAPPQITFIRMPDAYLKSVEDNSVEERGYSINGKVGNLYIIEGVREGGIKYQDPNQSFVGHTIQYVWKRDQFYFKDFDLIDRAVDQYFTVRLNARKEFEEFTSKQATASGGSQIPPVLLSNFKKSLFNNYKILATAWGGKATAKIANYDYLFSDNNSELVAAMFKVKIYKAKKFESFPSVANRPFNIKYQNPFTGKGPLISSKFSYEKK